jgi:hypothetical protein
MGHVVGISPIEQQHVWPLETEGRIRFDTQNFHTLGYFSLLSPAFDHFARRDAQSGIESINVMFVLNKDDLTVALQSLSLLEAQLVSYPQSWRTLLGTKRPPRNAPSIRIEPLLFKRRALAIVGVLRRLVHVGMAQDKRVVYGNGVSYPHLCGIKPQPGTVVYS